MKKTIKKRAFISAIAMLIVSAIVLTSSTYAWFSMAKRVEVNSMDLTITSPDGVQISANTSAWTTSLTKEDFTGKSGTRFAAELTGGATAANADQFGGSTAQVNHFPELMSPSSSELKTNNSLPVFFSGSIADTGRATVTQTTDAAGGYVVFDIFVKVASAQSIYWGNSTITCADNPDVTTAMRIGFVNCGASDDKEAAKSVLPASNINSRRCVMYEVDANNHTAASGVASGTYDVTRYSYQAATNVTVSGANKNIISSGVRALDNSSATSANARLVRDTDDRTVGGNNNARFDAQAGINRLRVYVWMEGNDIDCANDVAGSVINFNLVLEIA